MIINVHPDELGIAIGNVRGPRNANLVFIGGAKRSKFFDACDPDRTVSSLGSVEVFDLQASSDPHACLVLPPADTLSDCAPLDVKQFGHDVCIADINDNGFDDLIVGAHGSDTSTGRVYVFFGYEGFTNNPHYRWVGIIPRGSDGFEGGQFGVSVAASDLDGDEKNEIIIGQNERSEGVGRVYIVSGAWLTGRLSAAPNAISMLPDATANPNDVQILVNPRNEEDDFGWRVYAPGDLGGDATGAADSSHLPDVLIHSSDADATVGSTTIQEAGALFAYFNNGSASGFVKNGAVNTSAGPLLLTSPGPSPDPQTTARYGRGAARVSWLDGNASTGTLSDYLVVGEPDASVTKLVGGTPTLFRHAGRVFLLAIPLQPGGNNEWSAPLSEYQLDAEYGIFGAMIATGDYIADQTNHPGQQIIISARGWQTDDTVPLTDAGRVYTYKAN